MTSRAHAAGTVLLLGACAGRPEGDLQSTQLAAPVRCDEQTPPPLAHRSPGGTPEVGIDDFVAARCRVRLIDVRTRSELHEGVIAGSEHVPLEQLANRAPGWSRDEPIVFVCRSGRRSGAAARELAEMGFTRVASLTGGILAWQEGGGGLEPYERRRPAPLPEARKHPLSLEDIRTHVADRDRVRMTKAARLLLHGTQACVDGRDAHAIVGTPGGDAGELLLALSVAEQLGRAPFSAEAVERVFGDYLDAFGHFYLHTDSEAASRWLEDAGLSADDTEDIEDAEALLREPPEPARARLLETVAEPHHVGCGHLRLSLQHAEAYGVRPGLVRDVLVAYFERLWSGDDRLEFVVLEGDHAESAILRVEMGHPVHAYSNVPLVSPRVGDTEVFVVHPEVSAFIRGQNAAFLLEEVPTLTAAGVDEQAFLTSLQSLAEQQIGETIAYLAPDLPVFEVHVGRDRITVRGAESADAEADQADSG